MAIYVNGKLVAGGGGSSGGSINPDDIKDLVKIEGSGKIKIVGDLDDDTTPYKIEFRTEDEDPGDGLPKGGTAGQVLVKKSDKNYDTKWENISSGESESNSASDITYSNGESGANATNVQDALDELFQSGSEGKALIASAVTSKGVTTEADASFETISNNINQIYQIKMYEVPFFIDGDGIKGSIPGIWKTVYIDIEVDNRLGKGLTSSATDDKPTSGGFVIKGIKSNNFIPMYRDFSIDQNKTIIKLPSFFADTDLDKSGTISTAMCICFNDWDID